MKYNLNLVELGCPKCQHVMNARPQAEPWATRCLKCMEYLFVHPMIQNRVNRVTIEFTVIPVPKPQTSALKAVANQ